jgi:DNA-binding NarL/FixJ family response regulator
VVDPPQVAGFQPIRVLIADDEALVRAGFRARVESASDLVVCGEAATGTQAVRLARETRPDVVLMDIRMPTMDGVEAIGHILTGTDAPRIIVVTTFDQDEHVFAALQRGAGGFLVKDTPPEQLLDAIRVVAAGQSLLTPEVTRRLIAEFVRRSPPPPPDTGLLNGLTARELDVLRHIAAGRSNTQIADDLTLSVSTVKTHINRLLAKLQARDRAQLVVAAYESGIVTPRNETPS